MLSNARSWIRRGVNVLPHRQKRQLRQDVDALQEEMKSLRQRNDALEGDCRETRWLALETRRDIYVRICRGLAPDVRVASGYEPKVLVALRNHVADLTDGAEGSYFSLVPSEGDPASNRWVADGRLSKYIVALLGSEENADTHLRLGVIGLDGNPRTIQIRWDSIQHVRGAGDIGRAILTIEPQGSMGAFEMLNAIVASMTINDVGAILVRHGRLVPAVSEVKERAGGE